MDVDQVFAKIGDLGLSQWKYVLILSTFRLNMGLHFFQYTFIRRSMPYQCFKTDNETEHLVRTVLANETGCPEVCDRIDFDTTHESTLMSEWDLVCQDEWLGHLSFTLTSLGLTLGSTFLGFASDKFGRKSVVYAASLVMLVSNQVGSMVMSFYIYCACRSIIGVCVGGIHVALTTICSELVGPSKRGVVSILLSLGWALDIVLLSVYAYFLPHWRHLGYAASITSAPLLLTYFVVPESPRWLISQGRVKEAVEILTKMAIENGKPFVEPLVIQTSKQEATGQDGEGKKANKERLWHLFRHQRLSFMFLAITVLLSANFLSYFGLTFLAGPLSGDLYIGTALSGIVEVPADTLASLLMGFFGRTAIVTAGAFGTGICLILVYFIDLPSWAMAVLVIAGKMFSSGSACISFIHLNEIFPTSLRTTSSGAVFFISQSIGSLCPYLLMLQTYQPRLDCLVLGALSVFGSILYFFLVPDTLNKKMPETISQTKDLFLPAAPKEKKEVNGSKKMTATTNANPVVDNPNN